METLLFYSASVNLADHKGYILFLVLTFKIVQQLKHVKYACLTVVSLTFHYYVLFCGQSIMLDFFLYRNTPLHLAAFMGRLDIVYILLRNSAKVSHQIVLLSYV